MSTAIHLTARVFRDEGMYIAQCDELGWSTHGATLDEVLAHVPRMVRDYFAGYHTLGRLAPLLARFGFNGPLPEILEINVRFDLQAVAHALHAEQRIDVSLAA